MAGQADSTHGSIPLVLSRLGGLQDGVDDIIVLLGATAQKITGKAPEIMSYKHEFHACSLAKANSVVRALIGVDHEPS